ncbi:hypothetical protein [Parapedobacter sp. ISTM3]|nr:hypothetical protein [Parapedobacter sp. ISTM3]
MEYEFLDIPVSIEGEVDHTEDELLQMNNAFALIVLACKRRY